MAETNDGNEIDWEREFLEAIESSTRSTLKNIVERHQSALRGERKNQAQFQKDILRGWRSAFDLYDLCLHLAIQLGNQTYGDEAVSAEAADPLTWQVITRLHVRACLVAQEVRTLLVAGFPSGAHARWRSLHELAVTAHFVKEHAPEIAQRYIDHAAVDSMEALKEYDRFYERLGYEPIAVADRQRVAGDYNRVIAVYGSDFGKPNGWARSVIQKTRIRFQDLEDAVEMNHLRPFYRMASANSVHATYKSTSINMGLIDDGETRLLGGPSNFGLADAGHGSLISLEQCTVLLLTPAREETIESDMELLVGLQVLSDLVRQAGDAFLRIQKGMEAANICAMGK